MNVECVFINVEIAQSIFLCTAATNCSEKDVLRLESEQLHCICGQQVHRKNLMLFNAYQLRVIY